MRKGQRSRWRRWSRRRNNRSKNIFLIGCEDEDVILRRNLIKVCVLINEEEHRSISSWSSSLTENEMLVNERFPGNRRRRTSSSSSFWLCDLLKHWQNECLHLTSSIWFCSIDRFDFSRTLFLSHYSLQWRRRATAAVVVVVMIKNVWVHKLIIITISICNRDLEINKFSSACQDSIKSCVCFSRASFVFSDVNVMKRYSRILLSMVKKSPDGNEILVWQWSVKDWKERERDGITLVL